MELFSTWRKELNNKRRSQTVRQQDSFSFVFELGCSCWLKTLPSDGENPEDDIIIILHRDHSLLVCLFYHFNLSFDSVFDCLNSYTISRACEALRVWQFWPDASKSELSNGKDIEFYLLWIVAH